MDDFLDNIVRHTSWAVSGQEIPPFTLFGGLWISVPTFAHLFIIAEESTQSFINPRPNGRSNVALIKVAIDSDTGRWHFVKKVLDEDFANECRDLSFWHFNCWDILKRFVGDSVGDCVAEIWAFRHFIFILVGSLGPITPCAASNVPTVSTLRGASYVSRS
jgi:hypothetical protein